MSKGKVTVLGSNGHLGNAAMTAFRDAGWTVTGLGRSNRRPAAAEVLSDASGWRVIRRRQTLDDMLQWDE